ncbi:MAG TPA: hypothetical protein VGS20_14475 [Candidatus Acidoferrales bacterium]|nr:hypothetical protein [Candidatus Acidoferrales bacterium]
MHAETRSAPTPEALAEENRRLRRLRLVVQMALEAIAQGDMPYQEASDLVTATRRVALQLFPGKEAAFDLLYRPKFQRLLSAVYRLQ